MKVYQRDGPLEIARGGEGRVNNIAKETGQKKYSYPVGGCEFLKPQKKKSDKQVGLLKIFRQHLFLTSVPMISKSPFLLPRLQH